MGGGRLGSKLALDLISDGHHVNLIEIDDVACNDVALKVNATVICGDGTSRTVLENAQINDADIFVAATGDDNANLMASLLAREYQLEKIVARVNDRQHEKVFVDNDMVDTICPETIEAGYLEKLVLKPDIADLYVIDHGEAEILEIEVTSDDLVGKSIEDLSPTDDYIICGCYQNGADKLTICQPEMVLKYGDRISILVKRDAMKDVLRKFT
ncbi:MAG TPA: TrkA family potassium uptake protein [Methanobacteriaceae archaeon]|nr:TrkA family potassium uptake protein [Methanobacteriaceae archaeon]